MNLYSNFTGATAWYLRTIERMAGVLADFDGLRIAPAAPPEWREYEVRKHFRGIHYHFRFHHKSKRNAVTSVVVDGRPLKPVDGEFAIPLPKRKPAHAVQVEVVM
jgi:cellobiose phosphorylase